MSRLALAAALIFLAAPLARAQSVSTTPCISDPGSAPSTAITSLTYDVASIRQNKSGDGSLRFRDPPHEAKLSFTNMTMKNLIENAYGISDFQLSGGPAWLDSDRFDIEAKSDDSVNAQLLKLNNCDASQAKQQMLQSLLADRLKLTVHRGAKPVSGYDLVLAKNGPKFNESKPAPAGDTTPRDGSSTMRAGKLGYDLTSQKDSISSLASWLAAELHCPVQDKTALTGKYDIKLQWSEENGAAPSSDQDPPYPVIFTAIQEQLGLKLQPAKLTVDTIVIDHVEPPSPN
jgi:uncharacterized protein (TIGR03435 family)